MSIESNPVKATKDITSQGVRIVDGLVKKAWSIMDAAVEKQVPSEILNQKAIQSIQGKT